jgi:hypothetical protein
MPLCTSFKVGLLDGEFDFSSNTTQVFKVALFTSTAALSVATTAYTTSNEVANGNGYTTGGETLTISTNPTSLNGGAYLSFTNPAWTASSFTCRYALIYKADGVTNPAVFVHDFGSDQQVSAGTLTLQFPSAALGTPIILIL